MKVTRVKQHVQNSPRPVGPSPFREQGDNYRPGGSTNAPAAPQPTPTVPGGK